MATYAQELLPLRPVEAEPSALTELFGLETRIAKGKLETLAAEIHGRICIHANNANRIERDREVAQEMLNRFDQRLAITYGSILEKSMFYRTLFGLEQERRKEDVECWRDVVLVMRDFLEAWESHERIQAKGRLFADA